MNRIALITMITAIAVLFTACEPPTAGRVAYNPPTLEQFMESEVASISRGRFLIEGDMLATDLAEVEDFYEQEFGGSGTAAGSRSTVSLKPGPYGMVWDTWTETEKLNLTFCVSNAFGDEYYGLMQRVMLDACSNWEQFANIEFRYVRTEDANAYDLNPNVLFVVRPFDEADKKDVAGCSAYSFFPHDQKAERVLHVNQDYAFDHRRDGELYTDSEEKYYGLVDLMTHELGHILGLRHEHLWYQDASGRFYYMTESDDEFDPNKLGVSVSLLTGFPDTRSIMAYYEETSYAWWDPDPRVSKYDAVGIQMIYGPHPARVTAFWGKAAAADNFPIDQEAMQYQEDQLVFWDRHVAFAGKGFTVNNLNVTVLNGEIKYSANYTSSPWGVNPTAVFLSMDRSEFQAELAYWTARDYHVLTMDMFYVNSELRFAMILEKLKYLEFNQIYDSSEAFLAGIAAQAEESWMVALMRYCHQTGTWFVCYRYMPDRGTQTVFHNINLWDLVAQANSAGTTEYWVCSLDSWLDDAGTARYCGTILKSADAGLPKRVCWSFQDYLNNYRASVLLKPGVPFDYRLGTAGYFTRLFSVY